MALAVHPLRLGQWQRFFQPTVVDRPDKVAMMKQMAKMDMKMGAPAMAGNQKKEHTLIALMQKYGMKMDMQGWPYENGNAR